MDPSKDFLGTGWAFPVSVDKATGRVKMSSHERDIEESIRIILGTRCGERVMNPEFGSRLHDYIFSNNDYTTINLIKREVSDCLALWEPRITDIEVEVVFDGTGVGFRLDLFYTVRSTNNPYNMVFPFYETEGVPH